MPLIRAANKEQIELLMMGSRVPIDEPVKKHNLMTTHTRMIIHSQTIFLNFLSNGQFVPSCLHQAGWGVGWGVL